MPPGGETEEHYHRVSEEIYLFTHGSGRLRLGDEESDVTVGDTVVIRARHPPQALEHTAASHSGSCAAAHRPIRTRTRTNRVVAGGGKLTHPPSSRYTF